MVDHQAQRLRASRTRLKLSLVQFNNSAVRLAARTRVKPDASALNDDRLLWIVTYVVLVISNLLLLAILFIQFSFPGVITFT